MVAPRGKRRRAHTTSYAHHRHTLVARGAKAHIERARQVTREQLRPQAVAGTVSSPMWDPNEVEWSLEIFDRDSERLVDGIPLHSISEVDIRAHFAIDDDVEAIDGLEVNPADLAWLAPHLTRPVRHDLGTHSMFVSVSARSTD